MQTGVVAGGHGTIAPFLNFVLSQNCRKNIFLVGKFSFKNAKLGLKAHILKTFNGKLKIENTHNLLCRKFAAVCRKIATSCPASIFNGRRRCNDGPTGSMRGRSGIELGRDQRSILPRSNRRNNLVHRSRAACPGTSPACDASSRTSVRSR